MTLSPGGEVLIKNILLEKEALTTEELCILLLELRFQYELKKTCFQFDVIVGVCLNHFFELLHKFDTPFVIFIFMYFAQA